MVPVNMVKGMSKVLQGYFKGTSRVFQGYFKGISMVLQGYFKGTLVGTFLGTFLGTWYLKELEGSTRGVQTEK